MQVSMEGKKILEMVSAIKKDKEEKEAAKNRVKQEAQKRVSMFHQCKDGCVCNKTPCQARGLQECTNCHNVLRSVCSRTKCKGEDGSKPTMIKLAVPSGSRCKRLKFEVCADSESDGDSLPSEEESEDDAEEEGEDEQQGEVISTGECVRVVSGAFLGYYAMVVGESYGEELEIQYFEKKEKW